MGAQNAQQNHQRRGLLKTLLPPREDEEPRGTTVYLKPSLWEELEEISARTKEVDPKGKGYSRNQVIAELLEWGKQEFWKQDEARKKAAKK